MYDGFAAAPINRRCEGTQNDRANPSSVCHRRQMGPSSHEEDKEEDEDEKEHRSSKKQNKGKGKRRTRSAAENMSDSYSDASDGRGGDSSPPGTPVRMRPPSTRTQTRAFVASGHPSLLPTTLEEPLVIDSDDDDGCVKGEDTRIWQCATAINTPRVGVGTPRGTRVVRAS